METSFEFIWNVGTLTPHWYQVRGNHITAEENQSFNSNEAGLQQYIQSIMATSTEDVCKQLSVMYDAQLARTPMVIPFNRWPLYEIKRFSNPAYMDKSDSESPLVSLVPVDWTQIADCLELTVITRPKVTIVSQDDLVCIDIDELGVNCQVGTDDEHIVPLSFSDTTDVQRTELGVDYFVLGVDATGSAGYMDAVLLFRNYSNNVIRIFSDAGSASIYRNDLIVISTGKILIQDIAGSVGEYTDLINARCLLYSYSSEGTIELSGSTSDPVVDHLYEPVDSNLIVTGIAGTFPYYASDEEVLSLGDGAWAYLDDPTYTSDMSMTLSGGARVIYDYESEVSLSLSDSADVSIDTSFWYSASGGLKLDCYYDRGIIDVEMVADVVISYFKVDYPVEDRNENVLPISPALINAACGCSSDQQTVLMTHNIVTSNVLSNFISRNSKSIPQEVILKYSSTHNSWLSQYHFTGIGNTDRTEKWDIVFELRCLTDEAPRWQFSALIRKTDVITGEDFDTRLLYNLETTIACKSGLLSFTMRIGTNTNGNFTTEPVMQTAEKEIFLDEIGLFRNPYWVKNPFLTIGMEFNRNAVGVNRHDVSSIFPEPYLV
jgi:hypothetical protein